MFSMRSSRLTPYVSICGAADDFLDVEDQGHAAVSEDGRAGHTGNLAQEAAHRFHDHLATAEEFVDDDSGAALFVLDDHDVLALLGAGLEAEDALDAEEGERCTPEIDHTRGKALRVLRHLRAFDDRVDGDDVGFIADADREAVDDGDGQRQTDVDGRPGARLRVDGQGPAQRFDVAPYDVHPDAAT